MIWASAKERGRPAKLAKSGCRNAPLPASFAYGETAAAAFLYSYVPFLLLGFVFQFIARHLLYTLNIIVVESFATSHHYCPMSVQPPSALTVTLMRSVLDDLAPEAQLRLYAETGQEYFDEWKAGAIRISEQHDMEWIKENQPAIWLLLQMIDD